QCLLRTHDRGGTAVVAVGTGLVVQNADFDGWRLRPDQAWHRGKRGAAGEQGAAGELHDVSSCKQRTWPTKRETARPRFGRIVPEFLCDAPPRIDSAGGSKGRQRLPCCRTPSTVRPRQAA